MTKNKDIIKYVYIQVAQIFGDAGPSVMEIDDITWFLPLEVFTLWLRKQLHQYMGKNLVENKNYLVYVEAGSNQTPDSIWNVLNFSIKAIIENLEVGEKLKG